MGSNQSSHAKPATESVKEEEKQTLFSVRGLVPKNKTTQDEQAAHEETVEDETPVIVSHAAVLSEDEEPILVEAEISEEESESDSEESDLEDEEDEDESCC
uniref:Uncharacterized protein n=1 Tax=Ditylum brightwellii TaxID=49249 RepID=A0A7S4UMR2_9STRA